MYQIISIHALREEGDVQLDPLNAAVQISIHALREEGDALDLFRNLRDFRFLSTPSARRATRLAYKKLLAVYNFYPRPPRGGRPTSATSIPLARYFYPRPPRGGRRLYTNVRSVVAIDSYPYF